MSVWTPFDTGLLASNANDAASTVVETFTAASDSESTGFAQTLLSDGTTDWFSFYGPLEIGVLIGQFFYGAFMIAACTYFARYSSHGFINKFVVGALLVTTTLETLLSCTQVIEFTAEHPTDISFLLTVSNRGVSWIRPVLYSMTALVSQVFLTFRLAVFARSLRKSTEQRIRRVVLAGLGVLCLAVIGAWGTSFGSIAVVGTASSLQDLVDPYSGAGQLYRVLTSSGMALVTFVDVLLTIFLSIENKFTRTANTGVRSFGNIVVGFTIRNAFLVTMVQVAQIVLNFVLPPWGAGFFPLFIGKLYALTVLCILAQPEPINRPVSRISRYAADCSTHALAIQQGLPRCPACGTSLPKVKEMIIVSPPRSPTRGSITRISSDDGMSISELKVRVNSSQVTLAEKDMGEVSRQV